MTDALRAFGAGVRAVLLAPGLVFGITVATMLAVLPFGLMLGSQVQTSLAQQAPVASTAADIDPEWWMEFRAHATGLAATFTPAIIGVAAPLDNLSSVLDASPRPWALAGPIALSTVVWAFLWGGILHRFAQGRSVGLMEFARAAGRLGPRFVAISLMSLPLYAVFYFAVHPTLFGPVYDSLAGLVSSEREAFFARLGLYAIFGSFLMATALVVDYARVDATLANWPSPIGSVRASIAFVRRFKGRVTLLYVMTGLLMAAMLTAYGSAEIYGGTRLGGWRAVAIGQAYIVARLALRLVLAASELTLYQTLPLEPGSGSGPKLNPELA